jgi:hypothetical protein
MAFQITARTPTGPSRQTRLFPASAAVLAMRWAERGFDAVTIEINGRTYDVEAFRKEFMNGARRRVSWL